MTLRRAKTRRAYCKHSIATGTGRCKETPSLTWQTDNIRGRPNNHFQTSAELSSVHFEWWLQELGCRSLKGRIPTLAASSHDVSPSPSLAGLHGDGTGGWPSLSGGHLPSQALHQCAVDQNRLVNWRVHRRFIPCLLILLTVNQYQKRRIRRSLIHGFMPRFFDLPQMVIFTLIVS